MECPLCGNEVCFCYRCGEGDVSNCFNGKTYCDDCFEDVINEGE